MARQYNRCRPGSPMSRIPSTADDQPDCPPGLGTHPSGIGLQGEDIRRGEWSFEREFQGLGPGPPPGQLDPIDPHRDEARDGFQAEEKRLAGGIDGRPVEASGQGQGRGLFCRPGDRKVYSPGAGRVVLLPGPPEADQVLGHRGHPAGGLGSAWDRRPGRPGAFPWPVCGGRGIVATLIPGEGSRADRGPPRRDARPGPTHPAHLSSSHDPRPHPRRPPHSHAHGRADRGLRPVSARQRRD